VVIYGCGDLFGRVQDFVARCGCSEKVSAIVDDHPGKVGRRIGKLAVMPLAEAVRSDLRSADEAIDSADGGTVWLMTFPSYRQNFDRLGVAVPADRVEAYAVDIAETLLAGGVHTICWLTTSACNSRCTICDYWQRPAVHLSAERIVETMQALPNTNHYLSGGEFFCHPQWKTILSGAPKPERVLVISNGLLPERVLQAADQYGVRQFSLSLDGARGAYQRIRGVDGYDRVIRTLGELKKRPGTTITLMICLSPWTSVEDVRHVEGVCREYGLQMAPLIYRTFGVFGQHGPLEQALAKYDAFLEVLNGSPVVCDLDRRFIALHRAWHAGRISLPCTSGLIRSNITEAGDVFWCADRYDDSGRLGNLYDASLPELMQSPRATTMANALCGCNECWNRSCRRYDLDLHWSQVLEQLKTPDDDASAARG
jgi:MoaA/NifB/PqqE/SkfB family radical SAM enzyme